MTPVEKFLCIFLETWDSNGKTVQASVFLLLCRVAFREKFNLSVYIWVYSIFNGKIIGIWFEFFWIWANVYLKMDGVRYMAEKPNALLPCIFTFFLHKILKMRKQTYAFVSGGNRVFTLFKIFWMVAFCIAKISTFGPKSLSLGVMCSIAGSKYAERLPNSMQITRFILW